MALSSEYSAGAWKSVLPRRDLSELDIDIISFQECACVKYSTLGYSFPTEGEIEIQ